MSASALIGWVAQPGIIAAVGSGKSELEGRVGYTYGTMIKRFCALGWVFTGIILAAMVRQGHVAPVAVNRLEAPGGGPELAVGTAMQALLQHRMMGRQF